MIRRFYVPPPALASDHVELDAALARRLSRVLRLRAGQEIALFDGVGAEARLRLDSLTDRRAAATVLERYPAPPEPPVRVRLYQSITKGERFEWLLEKGTEIGVASFVPLIAARAVVKTGATATRADRWRRIVVEAAEQCGRGAVPSVESPESFAAALAAAPGLVVFPYEAAGAAAPNIRTALNQDIDALFALAEISIFIGPEGGYEPAEVEQADAAGAHVVTLGSRVLRSETAGLVAATLVLEAVGELG
ncbi:MAG TPA: 16S rRNA (uracil(1498)-N(3))-methyltransferase [Dehalococcoidia bacterium]|nr:16S rRNA (uracil(1498)-N(3))-methyltransferase [Dehalococcoidia bacterium]